MNPSDPSDLSKKEIDEQTKKMEDYIKRKDEFMRELRLLCEKYRIDLVANVRPTIEFVDMIQHYEHVQKN